MYLFIEKHIIHFFGWTVLLKWLINSTKNVRELFSKILYTYLIETFNNINEYR